MIRVALVGNASSATACARVNRMWQLGLEAAGCQVVSAPPADVVVHHDYQQHFATCDPGSGECRIAVRTWDFGPFPRSWADRIGRDFDRLWVHSDWVRQKAVEAGVESGRVSVVPHGVDCSVFRPGGRAADPGRRFTFLFVGATVARKGVDILLRAYADAFTPEDPVCLVLKGHSGDVFYAGQHMSEAIAGFASDPAKPRIRHIDAYLPDEALAALYRGADVGVFPYRAEGFAMPILEAMACGLPCIVPRFGACLDYCTDENAFFVEPRRIRMPVRREMAFNALGFREQVDAVDFCEVPAARLAAALRSAFEAPRAERRGRGDAAARIVQSGWTWSHSIDRVLQLLAEVQPRLAQ